MTKSNIIKFQKLNKINNKLYKMNNSDHIFPKQTDQKEIFKKYD
jgi:hypothetical protein